MGALSDLLHRANPANDANGQTVVSRDSHDSQHSHAADSLREALRQAAMAEGLTPDLVAGLEDADVLACADLPPSALRAYLRMVARRLGMAAGIVPSGWDSVAECAMCGPVLLWPGAPATVTACGWCVHRKAGRVIPSPAGKAPR